MSETKRVIYYDQLDNNRPTSGDVIFVDNPTTGTHKMDLKSFVDMINNGFDSSIKSSGVTVNADNYSTIITDVNNQPVNTIYAYGAALQSKITNLPSNKAMTIINFAQKSTGGLGQAMLAIERNGSDDYLYFRTMGGSPAAWSSWVKVANSADVEAIREALDNLDIETDKTLSIDGKPADAKAAGDAINDLKADLSNLSVSADMIDANDKKIEYIDYSGYTLQTSSYLDYDGSIKADQYGLCATTGLLDISDVPDMLYVKFGSTVEGYTGHYSIILKNTNNTYSYWIYSQLPTSFCTKDGSIVAVNVEYLKKQGTRSKIGFNLTASDHYVKYNEVVPLTCKDLKWLNVGYSQIKDTNSPENLYNKTCSAFGGSTVSSEIATITAVNQGIMTNPFESNSNCVRVKAKITFTVPNVYVLLPYYANGSWNYGNLLNLDEIESGVEFSFDFDASNYIVYQSAEKFRLIFQTRTESGVSDYSGTITITSLSIQSLDTMRQSEYFNENFEQMMSNVFSGIDVAKTLPAKIAEIYTNPNGDRVIFGVGENNILVAIPVVPSKTLFFGNSLLLGMNTTSANHQYVYGMCATAPDKDYCHLVMNTVTGIKSSATYDRVHGAQFESLGTSDSFSALWNTTANTYTGQPLKNSFTSDLDLIIIQISDNINTSDKRTAFAGNVDALLHNVRNASPNARLLWVYGWFSSADTNAIIASACQKWGIESLNIHQYNTTANQGVSGQSYIDENGNTQTVSDAWITHPGDNGFSAIADAIIDKLGVD